MEVERRGSTRGTDPLTGDRRRADYTAAERHFSVVLQERLHELLEGKRNQVALLRKYPQQPDRLGCLRLPPGVSRADLRLPVVEQLTWEAVGFLRAERGAGPVSQSLARDGSVVEYQSFPTKYPHILIARTDRYADGEVEPIEITWCLQRVQNQRLQTSINRLLDAANLAFELVRVLR
jgi:hypothetical protein